MNITSREVVYGEWTKITSSFLLVKAVFQKSKNNKVTSRSVKSFSAFVVNILMMIEPPRFKKIYFCLFSSITNSFGEWQ